MHIAQQVALTLRCMMCNIWRMTKLAQHLADRKLSQREFAAMIETDTSVVSRFVRGEARPGLDLAFIIERVTQGAVPASSWAKDAKQGAAQ